MKPIAAVILAAGRGTRMNSDRPKVLHEAAGLPLLEHVLNQVREAGIRKIAVVIGESDKQLSSLIRKFGAELVWQRERLGTGHAAAQARNLFFRRPGGLLVLPADAPCVSAQTIRELVAMAGAGQTKAVVLTAKVRNPNGYGRIIRENGHVAGIREELDASPKERLISEINSGIYFFDAPSLFRGLGQVKKNQRKKEYYLTDVIKSLVRSGQKVRALKARNEKEVMGVNTRKELAEAHQMLNERELERHSKAGVTILDPAKTVIAAGVRIGRDTVIHPFSWIERDVTIGSKCQIGPFAKLRSGVRVEDEAVIGSFVELVRTRIGRKTFVKHLSYLGDAKIGRGVNVGAGTITANFDGKKKHQTIVEDKARLGCDTILIAPVKVGRGAETGAGAVICAGQSVPKGKTVVGVPAKVIGKRK